MDDQDANRKPQDPRVERLRPDPGEPAIRTRSLDGLWGDSDRPGYARLYLTRDLGVYAEFRVEDVVVTAEIPEERAPFVGEQSTHIELPRDANVDITHTRLAGDIDEFDLDIRLGARIRFASVGYASSGPNECTKAEDDTEFPCGHTCDPFLCKTFIGPGGGQCPDGGRGGGSNDCTDTCVTCETCETQCVPCYSQYGHTACGTCYTDPGQTECGGCNRFRRRR
jgi:hypothetical protein